MTPSTTHTCKVAICPINSGGECLEGFRGADISKCINFGEPVEDEEEAEGENISLAVPDGDLRPISSGEALAIQDGDFIANGGQTRVIVLAGSIKSGKTTLATAVYEAFRKGSFANCHFSGSETLLGFEERCHLSRQASGLPAEDTERTKAGIPEVLLHLRIRRSDGHRGHLNLLMCDMSGELFEAANQSDEALSRIPLLARADRIALVLDGEKLSQMDLRHRIHQDALTLIRSCLQVGQMHKRSNLDIIFSKQDLLSSLEGRDQVTAFQDELEVEIVDRFSEQLGSIAFHRIATRPTPDLAVENLFRSWVQEEIAQPYVPAYPSLDELDREIDRFIWKIQPEKYLEA